MAEHDMIKNLVAIDPGYQGGIVWTDENDVLRACALQENIRNNYLALLVSGCYLAEKIVYIEDVGYHVAGNNAQSSAKFARHVGELHGMLLAMGCVIETVRPVDWQSDFYTRGRTKADRKKIIYSAVKKILPGVKWTMRTADAGGIWLWARGQIMGTMVIECTCRNEFQDSLYGTGRRLANKCGKESELEYRCTICGTVHKSKKCTSRK